MFVIFLMFLMFLMFLIFLMFLMFLMYKEKKVPPFTPRCLAKQRGVKGRPHQVLKNLFFFLMLPLWGL